MGYEGKPSGYTFLFTEHIPWRYATYSIVDFSFIDIFDIHAILTVVDVRF